MCVLKQTEERTEHHYEFTKCKNPFKDNLHRWVCDSTGPDP